MREKDIIASVIEGVRRVPTEQASDTITIDVLKQQSSNKKLKLIDEDIYDSALRKLQTISEATQALPITLFI